MSRFCDRSADKNGGNKPRKVKQVRAKNKIALTAGRYKFGARRAGHAGGLSFIRRSVDYEF